MNCSHCQFNPAQFRCGECATVYCSKACAHQDWIGSHALICGGEKREREEEEEKILLTFMDQLEPQSFWMKPSRFQTLFNLIEDAGLDEPIPLPNIHEGTFRILFNRQEATITTVENLVRVFAAANYLDGDSAYNRLSYMMAERLMYDAVNPLLTQLPKDLYRTYILHEFTVAGLDKLTQKYPGLSKLVEEHVVRQATEMFPLLDNPVEAFRYIKGESRRLNKTQAVAKYPMVDADFKQIPSLGKDGRSVMYDEATLLQYLIRKYGGTLEGLKKRIEKKELRQEHYAQRKEIQRIRDQQILDFFRASGINAPEMDDLMTFFRVSSYFFEILRLQKTAEFDVDALKRMLNWLNLESFKPGPADRITFTPEFRARYPHLFN